MTQESVQYAFTAMYAALTEACALATGKPVEQLANFLIREMLDESAPPEARDLLMELTREDATPLIPVA